MVSKAITRYIRISPRKTRLVADMIRGKSIDEAQSILNNLNKKACLYIAEVLKSAIANAKRNPEISESDLYVSKVTVDGGPMFKRYRSGSMGRAMMIRHRTSHIFVELDLKKKKESPAPSSQSPVKETKKPATRDRRPATKIAEKPKVKKLATSKKGK